MAAPYGQFGTANYPFRTIPRDIITQYPGTINLRDALSAYGNLAYGPLSGGLGDIAGAKAMDPAAAEFQAGTEGGGGAFGTPGAGTEMFSKLINNAMAANATKQATQQQQNIEALKGINTTGEQLAGSIYGQQKGALELQAAEQEAQAKQGQGIMQLADILTNPKGLGANVMQMFGADPGTTPGGALFSGGKSLLSGAGNYLGGSGGAGSGFLGPFSQIFQGGGGLASIGGIGGAGDLASGLGASAGASGAGDFLDISSMFSSLGTAGGAAAGAGDAFSYLLDALPFAAAA